MIQSKVIDLIKSHRSIRKFTKDPVSKASIKEIVEVGRWAPSSHHVQAYSIIVIEGEETKRKLAKLVGNQQYVAECPVFFVICADFQRLKCASEKHNEPFEAGGAEQLLVGAVDAALVAQNMLIAARAFGLGGVMIGGIRNQPEEVTSLLNLPKYVFPVMGLCVGVPNQNPEQKPRLPIGSVVHHERYDEAVDALEDYDEVMEAYYLKRTEGKRMDTWTKQMAKHFSTPKRAHIGDFLKKQGFLSD
ncbi:oxygen-insensitive NADPH nitroreductase [Bacillus solitudinis]|uniref:oxygen-insensitive NADPH nitroreductase n=1 Tax=Bacillus solitudinis TaxID=2014074 RepID=UPI0029DE785E|nr:oxygen-insensitive NADPH nitroreductase [Bacillus solitudinis]